MIWRQVKRIALSGKAGLGSAAAVIISIGVIYAYWDSIDLPRPLWKRELVSAFNAFSKEHIVPLGGKIDGAAKSMNDLTLELERAKGREAVLQNRIDNLNRNVDRLERLTDRVFGRASRPVGAPVNVTPEAEDAARPQ